MNTFSFAVPVISHKQHDSGLPITFSCSCLALQSKFFGLIFTWGVGVGCSRLSILGQLLLRSRLFCTSLSLRSYLEHGGLLKGTKKLFFPHSVIFSEKILHIPGKGDDLRVSHSHLIHICLSRTSSLHTRP